MKIEAAVGRLAALAQETRLRIYRLLVEAGPQGLNAGAIAAALDIAPATLSFHLAHLARCGLVTSRQESRFIFYAANFAAMDELIAYLTENCCQGRAVCWPRATAAVAAAPAAPGSSQS